MKTLLRYLSEVKRKAPYQLILLSLACLFFGQSAIATEYQHGHAALEIWGPKGVANSPEWVQIWLKVMLFSFAGSLIFIWKHIEARWVLGGFAVGMLISRFIIPELSLIKLSGLVALIHVICWSPSLFFLLKNRPFTKGISAYAIWSGWITLVILFSFLFDIRDAAIYINHVIL